jgi:hypothetical protein
MTSFDSGGRPMSREVICSQDCFMLEMKALKQE